MTDEQLNTTVRYLKVLANAARLRLLGLVATRERSVGELAEILDLKEPTISHHLSKLSASGLVRMRPEGTVHLYRLNEEGLKDLNRELFTTSRVAALAPREEEDAWEAKVLRTYVADERLTKIPDVRKKRDVVLRWLVKRFEVGRRYPEREVNAVIGAFHPDFATLRRELIGVRLMERSDGMYWRIATG
jgi:hypothetical protein